MDPEVNTSQSYNTKQGIEALTGSLEDLHKLAEMRFAAARQHKESLDEFVVFGRFCAEGRGGFYRYNEDLFPPEAYDSIPSVLTKEEFSKLFSERGLDKNLSYSLSGSPHLPALNEKDPISGEGWDIENCHDAFPEVAIERIDLSEFTGKPISAARKVLMERDASLHPEDFEDPIVMNPALVDLSPCDELGPEAVKNEQGVRADVSPDYVIQDGDVLEVQVTRFYHGDTYAKHLAEKKAHKLEEEIAGLQVFFEECGFSSVSVSRTEMPESVKTVLAEGSAEELESSDQESLSALPWFEIKTEQGEFELGFFGENVPFLCLDKTGISPEQFLRKALPDVQELPLFGNLIPCADPHLVQMLLGEMRGK